MQERRRFRDFKLATLQNTGQITGVRVNYNKSHAVAGYASTKSSDDLGSAYLWVPRGQENSETLHTALTFEVGLPAYESVSPMHE